MTDKHQLDPLVAIIQCEQTQRAQRFLSSAFECVQNMLELVTDGQLSNSDSDLYRAAIVFAGAGLDGATKQLIRDALPLLLVENETACEKFEEFARQHIEVRGGIKGKNLARLLIAEDPRVQLINEYQRELTNESLQSVEQLSLIAGALGITDSTLRKQLKELRPAFAARNQIVHELDLLHTESQGDRSRRRRKKAENSIAFDLLNTGQGLINGAASILCEVEG